MAALSLLVPDPAAFDMAAIDHRLQSMAALAGAHPRADGLCTRLADLPMGATLARVLCSPVTTPSARFRGNT